jgi:hypothetical protein
MLPSRPVWRYSKTLLRPCYVVRLKVNPINHRVKDVIRGMILAEFVE